MPVDTAIIAAALAATRLPDAEIARRLGVTPQAVNGWRTKGTIGPKSALALAKLANIDPVGLLAGTVSQPLPVYAIKTDQDEREDGDAVVDVADIQLSAGAGAQAPEFVETRYRHTYRWEFLRSEGISNPADVKRCQVRGDSMERTLFHGDMVTINTSDRRIVDNCVYAIVVADQLRVKRLRRRRDGGLLIVSDNERYPIEEVPPDELDHVYIIGRAFDRSGKGGLT